MAHVATQQCVKKAEALIEEGDVDSLRYATLQLRMGIEYLFYELVPLYQKELPDDILSANWQPQRILDAILRCDPGADKDSRLAFGPSGGVGEAGWAKLTVETKAPNKKLLKKHYHRLGFYLHAPVDMVGPPLDKWRSDLKKATTSLSNFKIGQALSNVRVLIDITCQCCGRTIYRNKRGIEANGEMQCLNPECGAIYDVQFEGDEMHYALRQESFDCWNCGTKNHIPSSAVVDGKHITCVECGKRVIVRASFRLQPIEDEPTRASMTDAKVLEFQANAGNAILSKVNATQQTGDVVTAVSEICTRIVGSGSTLLLLHSDAKHDWTYDAVSVLRTIYDASLQALYIFHDSKQCDDLARRYIDFGIIEKMKLIRLFDKQATGFSKRMSQSKKRAAVESEIQKEYQRVCQKYGYDKLKEPPKNWYKGSLRDVARAAGYEAEYELLQKQLSGVVHSSYFGLQGMPRYEGSHLVFMYWTFAFRVLGKLAEHSGIQLDETEKKLIDRSKANIFDM